MSITSRRGFLACILACCLAAPAAHAGDPPGIPDPPRARVSYVSAEQVYLDAGRADGLRAGDVLRILRRDAPVTEVTLEHLAEHSASCRITGAAADVHPGDAAVVILQGPAPAPDDSAAVQTTAPATTAAPVPARAKPAAQDRPFFLRGRLSLQWLHSNDRSEADLDLTQPSLRFDLRSREPFAGGHELQVRGTLRQNRRAAGFSSPAENEWRNRVYLVTLSRERPDDRWHYSLGRITSRAVSGFGQLDGLLASGRLADGLRLGAFTGFTPDPRTSEPNGDQRKTGGFLAWSDADGVDRAWDLVLAAVGEYEGGETSREYLLLDGDLGRDGPLRLHHSAELEINRDWRYATEGRRFALSNAVTTVSARLAPRWSASLSHDRRELYRTWATRSLPDSLFHDAERSGLRLRTRWADGAGWSLAADGGVRGGAGRDGDTWSWGATAGRAGLSGPGSHLSLDLRGFDGPRVSGLTPSLRLDQPLRDGLDLQVAAGLYSYDIVDVGARRSHWTRVGARRILGRSWLAGLEYERDGGDDFRGDRLRADLTLRF
ncbi:MAG: hypothetical protein IPH09_04360 [bacterium]|nr:hypothetical protein [bacterium]